MSAIRLFYYIRGCETYVIREGYEGLILGNTGDYVPVNLAQLPPEASESSSSYLMHNLRFGDGALLKDGVGDRAGGRTVKGRYIVRVGWDDVGSWFAEVLWPCVFIRLSELNYLL
jgi:6-phosphofructokinase 1